LGFIDQNRDPGHDDVDGLRRQQAPAKRKRSTVDGSKSEVSVASVSTDVFLLVTSSGLSKLD